jgi:alkanesulfonate monooxygenase SsuD/methylene tetrahydromethanopterin reductase-like flavin-dependent oxidoreductase (luciferase family)
MQYGLTLPNGGAWTDPRALAGLAPAAEAAGWDAILVEDYVIWQNDEAAATYDPWVLLAAMAARTTHLRLGTSVTPLARRRPWQVARQAATLDQLSNGRVILGVGLGDTGQHVMTDKSFTHFGEETQPRARAQMLDEALTIITGLWTGEPFSFSGVHYQVKDVTFRPRPVQRPRIPIWVGGGYPHPGPTRRAARWDGACLYKAHTHYLQPDDIRAFLAIVREQRGNLDGYDIAVGGSAPDEDQGKQRAYMQSLAEAGITWWIDYVSPAAHELDEARQIIARGPLRIE